MALAMRLARGGRRNRPFHRIVVADKRMPRDGRYIEKLGTYDPLLPSNDENRVKLNEERIKYWLGQGAQPSHRVQLFLSQAGLMEAPVITEKPKKSAPSEKTLERIREKEEKKKVAEEAAKEAAAAPAPVEEAPAEGGETEAAAEAPEAKESAPAEDAKTEEAAPAEEKPAEEAKTEEAPTEDPKEEPKAEEAKAEKVAEEKAEEEPKE